MLFTTTAFVILTGISISMATLLTEEDRLLEQIDLYIATADDADISQMMEFYYNESTCFMPPDYARNGWCSQSNQTEHKYVEEGMESVKIGPNQSMVLCERRPVRSGPHYLVFLECEKFSKNKKGHQELVSFFDQLWELHHHLNKGKQRLLQQVDLYGATVNDADIAQMMEFYYNESSCFMRPDHARNGWCSQSNKTDEEYVEDVIESEEIGPNQGLVLCDTRPVISGPHYLVILECKKFSKNKNCHKELVSFFEALQTWKKEGDVWKLWIAAWNDLLKRDM